MSYVPVDVIFVNNNLITEKMNIGTPWLLEELSLPIILSNPTYAG